MALLLPLCETFLKRSWQRSAIVLAGLIALCGLPIDSVEARRVAPQASAAHPPAEAPKPAAHAAPAPAAEAPHPTPTPIESAGQDHGAPAATPAAEAHAPAAGAGDAAHGQPTAHGPPTEGAHGAAGSQAEGHAGQAAGHEESIWVTVARLFNFAVLVGGLIYFLRTPLAQHLAKRSQQIRGGLVTARETSERATAQLAELDRRLQALPGELEALRARGVQEIAIEERRIQAQAEAEKTRLIAEMERDVDVRVRVARKQLTEHAADLAVGLAADRVRETITDADQARLIDRYTTQVKDIHG
jgi:F0F1-type ATP synthase membrane subunit b/b'